jgi:uncharacterized membrane protein YgaE (UPF0421/DUF939 family)
MKDKSYKYLMVYVLKTIAGIMLSFLLSFNIKQIDYTWCLISVILVLSPEGHDAIKLAINRIKANMVGAGVGILFLLFPLANPLNLLLGASLSLYLCFLLKLEDAAKSTLAALVIILLYQDGNELIDASLQRLISVIAGCMIGLLVTYVFHYIFRWKLPASIHSYNEKEA